MPPIDSSRSSRRREKNSSFYVLDFGGRWFRGKPRRFVEYATYIGCIWVVFGQALSHVDEA